MKQKQIHNLNEEDKKLLLDRAKIHKCPDCEHRCGNQRFGCLGCPDMRAHEESMRVYKERCLEDLLRVLWKGDYAVEKIAQLERSIEGLKQDLEEANALQKLLEQTNNTK